ncbi:MAG: hypothetical protein QOE45_3289 [Frankiaceae bacterium]|nr:hypothetical protein [Frankiaceae bacterium]
MVATILAALFLPLLWGSDLLLRNGRTVGFVIAIVGFGLGELLFGDRDGAEPARAAPRSGPGDHEDSGRHRAN